MNITHTFFHWFILVLHVVFALLQLNDEGALPWIVGYGWVSVIAAMKLYVRIQPQKRAMRTLTFISLIFYLVWAAFWFPEVLVWIDMGTPSITSGMSAESSYIEYMREFFGLIICVGSMAYIYISGNSDPESL